MYRWPKHMQCGLRLLVLLALNGACDFLLRLIRLQLCPIRLQLCLVMVVAVVAEFQVDDAHRAFRVVWGRSILPGLTLVGHQDGPAVLGEGELVRQGTCSRVTQRQHKRGRSQHPGAWLHACSCTDLVSKWTGNALEAPHIDSLAIGLASFLSLYIRATRRQKLVKQC